MYTYKRLLVKRIVRGLQADLTTETRIGYIEHRARQLNKVLFPPCLRG